MTDEQRDDTREAVAEDGMRQAPTDPPEVVPAISSEQMGVSAGLGLSGFAQQNPEGGLMGDDEEEAWTRPDPDTVPGTEPDGEDNAS